jgi:hypothetical protein
MIEKLKIFPTSPTRTEFDSGFCCMRIVENLCIFTTFGENTLSRNSFDIFEKRASEGDFRDMGDKKASVGLTKYSNANNNNEGETLPIIPLKPLMASNFDQLKFFDHTPILHDRRP